MLVTEEAARKLVCPMMQAKCLGAGCMAWRKGYQSEPSATHEAREEGPWEKENDDDLLSLIREICGADLASRLVAGGKNEDDAWPVSEITDEIDEKLNEYYSKRFEAFKQEHTPLGDGWELADEYCDHDGMHVRWEKPGPVLNYCGLAGPARS